MREEIEMVRELISIVEENGLAELNIDFKGMKVEIKKEAPAPYPTFVQASSTIPAQIPAGAPQTQPAEQAEKTEKKEPVVAGVPVKSPLAGVFYRAPKPSAPPFVNVGDIVEKSHTLCIIEAMKLMNEITAEQRGKVVKICKENAEVVNEGEVLLYIEPEE